jgi:deoxyxylulose-5-phosphate synthase
VEISSGSLGHGLPLGVGLAHGLLARGLSAPRVFVLLGDAELDEGSNDEAVVYAGALRLPNLVVVAVDNQSSSHGWGPGGLEAGRDSSYLRLSTQANAAALPLRPGLQVVRSGRQAVVVAVGPMLDPVLDAVAGMDVTVAYTTTVRPFDGEGLRSLASSGTVVLVEPYQVGTSAYEVSAALAGRAHRLLCLGVPRVELRRYGSPEDHARAHGLDAAGIRRSVSDFLGLT